MYFFVYIISIICFVVKLMWILSANALRMHNENWTEHQTEQLTVARIVVYFVW